MCEQTVDSSLMFFFKIDGHPCMVFRLCTFVESFYLQFRIFFPHVLLHDLPCRKTKKILFLHQVSLKLL